MSSHHTDPLRPLGLTSLQFVEASRARGRAGPARDEYKALFRAGRVPAGCEVAEYPVTATLVEGATAKFVLRLTDPGWDGLETESVLIPMPRATGTTTTLCVSSQVGCAMGCRFCETAQMGLIRNLRADHIVHQWFAATHRVQRTPDAELGTAAGNAESPQAPSAVKNPEARSAVKNPEARSAVKDPEAQSAVKNPQARSAVKNIVFMGMGEPTDNIDEVIQAIRVLTDHDGAQVPASNIAISTVGNPAGIERIGALVREHGFHRLNLALSLNAPNDEIRSQIMPVNKAWPMAMLKESLLAFPRYSQAAFCVEYVLIPGVNDRDEHCDEVCAFLRDVRCSLNVIPYNPRRNSPWPAPDEREVDRFIARAVANGQFTKRRGTKGRNVMAACGQLGNERIRNRRVVCGDGESATVSLGIPRREARRDP